MEELKQQYTEVCLKQREFYFMLHAGTKFTWKQRREVKRLNIKAGQLLLKLYENGVQPTPNEIILGW
jgi:hypothetical protein